MPFQKTTASTIITTNRLVNHAPISTLKMNKANQFFDKFLKSFDKVSDNEKKEYLKGYPNLCYSQNTIIENLEEGIISIDINGIIQGINKKHVFCFQFQETLKTNRFQNIYRKRKREK